MSNLEEKFSQFEATLTPDESFRLSQLRASAKDGKLLTGQSSYNEAVRRHEDVAVPSMQNRKAVNDALKSKLTAFQQNLSAEELQELTIQLSGNVGKMQSSFGVSE